MPDPYLPAQLQAQLKPVLDELTERAAIADRFVDKDVYRILICTLWVNLVLDPAEAGIGEALLEPVHDLLNQRIESVLGRGESLTTCFRYLDSKDGERAMKETRLAPNHRDMLLYFASIILDPDGHRRWMEELRNRPSR